MCFVVRPSPFGPSRRVSAQNAPPAVVVPAALQAFAPLSLSKKETPSKQRKKETPCREFQHGICMPCRRRRLAGDSCDPCVWFRMRVPLCPAGLCLATGKATCGKGRTTSSITVADRAGRNLTAEIGTGAGTPTAHQSRPAQGHHATGTHPPSTRARAPSRSGSRRRRLCGRGGPGPRPRDAARAARRVARRAGSAGPRTWTAVECPMIALIILRSPRSPVVVSTPVSFSSSSSSGSDPRRCVCVAADSAARPHQQLLISTHVATNAWLLPAPPPDTASTLRSPFSFSFASKIEHEQRAN